MGMKWSKIFDRNIKTEITVIDDNRELPDVRKIAVPDLKQYLLKGYEEIRQVKQEKEKLKEELEKSEKYKQLYEATLVTLHEFEKRDNEAKEEFLKIEDKIKAKNARIDKLVEEIAYYKSKEHKVDAMLENIEQIKTEESEKAVKNYKEELEKQIDNYRGNISKSKLINLIENIKY